MLFKDRCVIVTGAAGNLGAAVALELANQGANLVCVDRTEPLLATLIERLPKDIKALPLPGLDLTKPEDAEKMVAEAISTFGRVDALANTIGGFRMGRVAENALADWDFLLNLNARSVLVASAAVLPPMIARKFGRILHVSAGVGHKGAAGLAVYSASKASVMRIVESLAEEHRAVGITADCILPATIDTPQNRAAMPEADFSTWVAPAAIARVVAFLVSPEAGAVTGAAIPVVGPG
jgi:NAD(P)-dependent dehydrogenase (short-subunit alcohol dehydrogenase family)